METTFLNNESHFKKVLWGAAIAGAFVALSTEVTLNFLGMGLGLTSVDLSTESLFATGIGAILWISLSGILTMGFGGWITGKAVNCSCGKTRMLHGLLSWSLATLITVAATATTAGTMIGGASSIVNSSVRIAEKTSPDTLDSVTAKPANTQNQGNTNEENVKGAANNLGSASIVIFIAFIISALSGIGGAYLGSPQQRKDRVTL